MGPAEAAYLERCIAENWVATRGRFVREFEALFAERHGQGAAVSTNSGTAALHLVCRELGIGPGDEVVVPAMTFAASANAVMYTGATPVFADIEADTFGVDPAAVERCLTPRTRAIMVVHLYGHPVRMDEVRSVAATHDLPIIEDATEALGSSYRGQPCGTLGDFGCFSFNGNKVITTGGGGMVLARDGERLAHIRHLSMQARVPGSPEYIHDEVGYNYGLPNLGAAVGLAQLERLDELLTRRRELARRYASALAGAEGLRFTEEAAWARSNHWLMSVELAGPDPRSRREALVRELAGRGIEARPFFVPLPTLDPYGGAPADRYPVATDVHARALSIPSSASLTDADQDRVLAALLAAAT